MLYEMTQSKVLFCFTNSRSATPVFSRFTADDAVGGVYWNEMKMAIVDSIEIAYEIELI